MRYCIYERGGTSVDSRTPFTNSILSRPPFSLSNPMRQQLAAAAAATAAAATVASPALLLLQFFLLLLRCRGVEFNSQFSWLPRSSAIVMLDMLCSLGYAVLAKHIAMLDMLCSLCYAVLCYAMLCYAMLCYRLLCSICYAR
jgi:hypothetical protein